MKLEFRKTLPKDTAALRSLWETAFADSGDSPEYLDFAFSGLDPAAWGLGAFDRSNGGRLVSMLLLLPAVLTLGEAPRTARYVYGAATVPAYRRRGILRELEEHAVRHAREEGAAALALVPGSPELFQVYRRLGYRTRFYLGESRTAASLSSSTVLVPCGADEFLSFRRKLMNRDGNTLELGPELCEFRYYDYLFPCPGRPRGEIYRVEQGASAGYVAGFLKGDTYQIRETDLSGDALSGAAGALLERSGARRVLTAGRTGRRVPYGMLKPLDPALTHLPPSALYMNLMLD